MPTICHTYNKGVSLPRRIFCSKVIINEDVAVIKELFRLCDWKGQNIVYPRYIIFKLEEEEEFNENEITVRFRL